MRTFQIFDVFVDQLNLNKASLHLRTSDVNPLFEEAENTMVCVPADMDTTS